ncbi:hypothetical protein [Sphingomonas sp.]|uniref:hypothetical protein n=1 Tax=Sphingomonas sp. TaxID=28214 RepID=UPI001B2A8DBD|nr:hypothetical protein [Sphingomonas sp.]MBO9714833.1 hypothetical protein [Sphingomonas sp.]
MMRRAALLALPLLAGLAACNAQTNQAANDLGNSFEDTGAALGNMAEGASDSIGNGVDAAGNSLSNAGDDLGNRADKVGNAIDDATH